MKAAMHYLLLMLLVGTFCVPAVTIAASSSNNSKQKSQQLNQLTTEINQLQKNIQSKQSRKQNLERKLRASEKAIAKITQQLQTTDLQLKEQNIEIAQLKKQQTRYQQQLHQQLQSFSEQLRAKYLLGNQEYIKVILNQQNPNQLSRTLRYYHYFTQARLNTIAKLNSTITKLQNTQQLLTEQIKKQQKIQLQQQKDASKLSKQQARRKIILAALDKSISTQQQKLTQLKANRAQLGKIIKKLQQQQAAAKPVTAPPFYKLKGKLNWPTKGKIVQRYGSSIAGSVKRTGVFIAAPAGQNVKAVAAGKVIFSDWLRGYGLLIIVSHNNGYMTLYGHNQSLYYKTGSYVRAGTIIAKVGSSGGLSQSGLYFEIRRKGKPLNPARWCK